GGLTRSSRDRAYARPTRVCTQRRLLRKRAPAALPPRSRRSCVRHRPRARHALEPRGSPGRLLASVAAAARAPRPPEAAFPARDRGAWGGTPRRAAAPRGAPTARSGYSRVRGAYADGVAPPKPAARVRKGGAP